MSRYGVNIRITQPAGPDGSFPLESAGITYDGTHIPDEHRGLGVPNSAASAERYKPTGAIFADPPPDSERNRGTQFGDLTAHEAKGIASALRNIDRALMLSRATLALTEIDSLLEADGNLQQDPQTTFLPKNS